MMWITRMRPEVWLGVLALVLISGYGIFLGSSVRASQRNTTIGEQETGWRVRQREIDLRLNDSRWILLKYAEFDPLENEPVSLKIGEQELHATSLSDRRAKQSQSASGEGNIYFIIQFNDAIKPPDVETLVAKGYEIVGYVPHNAYLVRANASQESKIVAARDSGQYRWVGAY